MVNNYEELVKSLHCCFGFEEPAVADCENCMMKDKREEYNYEGCCDALGLAAADAIEELQAAVEREKTYAQFWEDAAKTSKVQYEELLRSAKKMHTWIFLHTGDEQKAYDECGLSDEMNAALGYGGRLEIKVNDDV